MVVRWELMQCFFPIFHSSSLLPTALPSPFKYVEETEHLVRMLGFFLFFLYAKRFSVKIKKSPPKQNKMQHFHCFISLI